MAAKLSGRPIYEVVQMSLEAALLDSKARQKLLKNQSLRFWIRFWDAKSRGGLSVGPTSLHARGGMLAAPFLSLERLVGLENLSKLNRFPKVSDWVKADADGATLQFTETAPSAPIYGGRRVVSAYDSSVEAARRIALLPERASDITCFGVGMAYSSGNFLRDLEQIR